MFEFLRNRKRVVGIDAGSSYVKVLVFEERDGRAEVVSYSMAEVQADRRPEALSAAIQEAGGSAGRIVTSVSGKSVTVRYIVMPQMTDDELKISLPLEADKYMPYDIGELYLDGQKLGINAPEGQMRVLMVSAKKTLVQDQMGLLQQGNCSPSIVDVDSFALGNAWEVSGEEQENAPVVALVDVGATKTNINILKQKVSCFTREVYVGGKDFTEVIAKKMGIGPEEAETLKRDPGEQKPQVLEAVSQVCEDLGNEIRLSFDYFESQFEEEVAQVRLSGGGARLTGLQESFQGVFGKPTQTWNPVDKLPLAQGLDAARLRDNAQHFAIVVGLAARIRDTE